MLVLTIVIAALLLPALAEAKVTCAEPQRPAGAVPLRGLPYGPVAGREYRLTAVLRPDEGVNPAPHLAAEYCGAGSEPVPGAGGWFRARGDGEYTLVLRFDRPGPWVLSFMDRRGVFHPLGFRQVRPAGGPDLPPKQPLRDRVAHQGAESLRNPWPRFGYGDVTGLASLPLQQLLWIFQPGAVLEQQAHLAVARVYRADVAGLGVAEADPVPAPVDALAEVRLGGQDRLTRP
jgi:hypothetical protein